MKKKITLFITLTMFVRLLVGCSQKEETPLTVYVVQTDALYENAVEQFQKENPDMQINVVTFESYDAVNEQMKTEVLSGEGPDVLLFNSLYSSDDPYKIAVSGSVMELDKQAAELSEKEYFKEILAAGQMNGHQYFIPLSWNIPQVYATQTTATENGHEDLREAFLAEAEAPEDTEKDVFSMMLQGQNKIMSVFMELAGTKLFDSNTGEVTDSKDAVREIAKLAKTFYDNMEEMPDATAAYMSNVSFRIEDFSFMHNLRFTETMFQVTTSDEMYFATFPRQNDDGITAQVVQYGAINANTDNPEEAWALLQYILDTPPDMDFYKYQPETVYFSTVNKNNYDVCVIVLKSQQGTGPRRKVGPLSKDLAAVLEEIPEQITEAVIPNVVHNALIDECMEAYLKGEESFDECYDTLVQRTKLYLSE